MTPVYVYEPIKTIHFDFNVQQLEDYLSPRNEIITVVRELIPRHQIFDVYGDIRECRVEMRYTYRILNSNEKLTFLKEAHFDPLTMKLYKHGFVIK